MEVYIYIWRIYEGSVILLRLRNFHLFILLRIILFLMEISSECFVSSKHISADLEGKRE